MRILILMVIANSVIVHSTQAYVVISTKIKRHQIIESSIKNRRICRFLQKHENTDSASNTLGLRRKVHEYQLKQQPSNQIPFAVFSNAWKVIVFSGLIYLCGAFLGPFLDSYHSSFGVLKYDNPIVISTIPLLEGTIDHPALTTAWWVPELFGLAGITIGWLYVILDASFTPIDDARRQPSAPIILYGIGFFAFQYWLSGFLFSGGCAENVILSVMGTLAGFGFILFDNTKAGTIASLATCVGGPLIEALLLSVLGHDDGYRYADPGWTGLFPIWIVPGERLHFVAYSDVDFFTSNMMFFDFWIIFSSLLKYIF